MPKPVLGRGLGALLGGSSPQPKPAEPPKTVPAATPPPAPVAPGERVERIPLTQIHPSPLQPRKEFSDESLRELADSIKEQGFIQPLIARRSAQGYELIAGERRWRASQLIPLTEAPVIVREADDITVLELALIENLQRENLNAVEEALGYERLIKQFQLTQEQVATKVGKGRVAVANALRLLNLPPEVQAYVRTGRISAGHAKALLSLGNAADQKQTAEEIIRGSLSVRATEQLVAARQGTRAAAPAKSDGKQPSAPTEAHVSSLQNKLTQRLGTKVGLRYKGGKGSVEIHFFNDADLERILEILGVSAE
ncbi:MAG TPA: ParB/RepB/Spo0J family partition protein [Methylomirabilota bacterium]|nr:ParB/RepB/Spo0J family partition protein [Methylomirabilota bacterium]